MNKNLSNAMKKIWEERRKKGFHFRPRTEEERRHMSKKIKEYYKTNKRWNSGLTKNNHPSLAKMSITRSSQADKYRTKEYREKMSKIAKEKGFGKWMIDKPQQCKIFKDSSIERAMEAEFIKRGMQYKKQVPLHRVACVDFLLGDKTIVQCDGEYWHNLPERKEKDTKQDKILKSMGYKIYRFWESEIKNDVSKCVSSIK